MGFPRAEFLLLPTLYCPHLLEVSKTGCLKIVAIPWLSVTLQVLSQNTVQCINRLLKNKPATPVIESLMKISFWWVHLGSTNFAESFGHETYFQDPDYDTNMEEGVGSILRFKDPTAVGLKIQELWDVKLC